MSIAVFSDIHANLEALEAVIEDARSEGADRFVCLGDIVGYNADPAACLDLVRDLCDPCIRGNHDEMASSDAPLTGINEMARTAMVWTRAQLDDDRRAWLADLPMLKDEEDATYVHASLLAPAEWNYIYDEASARRHLSLQKRRVCFVGHTHMPNSWRVTDSLMTTENGDDIALDDESRVLVNVGSVGQPRDGDPRASYALYDPEADVVHLRRVPYEVAITQAKIRAAGLPEALATRLS